MKNCMNMTAEKRKVRSVDRKLAVRLELTRDNDSRRLDMSPGVNSLINVAGRSSRRDMMAVCNEYSTLSLIRTTTRLRAISTIVSPAAALKSKVAMGTIWLASPEGMTSEKISLHTYGVNMVRSVTPKQAIKQNNRSYIQRQLTA